MRRGDFLKTLVLGGFASSLMPGIVLGQESNSYTIAQLTGKGNPDITGTGYRSKMHREAREAFDRMKQAASLDGFAIEIVSAYRSYERQKQIFEKKYKGFLASGLSPESTIEKIIEYSTIPGTSRHHWGTDLDLIDGSVDRPENVLLEDHFHQSGPFKPFREWMECHAAEYGFHLVYTNEPQRKGFEYEPWHYSYKPVAVPMLRAYLKLDIPGLIKDRSLLGSEHFSTEFIEQYINHQILSINPLLL